MNELKNKSLASVKKSLKARHFDYLVYFKEEKVLWAVRHGGGVTVDSYAIWFSNTGRATRIEVLAKNGDHVKSFADATGITE